MPLKEIIPSRRIPSTETTHGNGTWFSGIELAQKFGIPVDKIRKAVVVSGARFRVEAHPHMSGRTQILTPVEDLSQVVDVLRQVKSNFQNVKGDLSSGFRVKTRLGTTLILEQ